MKWIFTLLFLFSFNSFAVESVPAPTTQIATDLNSLGGCGTNSGSENVFDSRTFSSCQSYLITYANSHGWTAGTMTPAGVTGQFLYYKGSFTRKSDGLNLGYVFWKTTLFSSQPYCPPSGNPTFTIGPVKLNGVDVCQKPPKVCMMGAILRIASDGKETCVSNCSAATGLIKTSQFYFQAGPDVGSTAGQVQCYGQCAVQTSGLYTQLSNGAYTGTFAFTGANCPVIRPEPTVDSESNTGGNGNAPAVDESTTSEGTDNALGELSGAASSATGSQVQPSATGPDGTSTLNDVAQTVADAANAQIQATSSQNVATGNLIANTTKDLQNTIIRTGGASATSALQAQGNGKLDGIKSTLDEISDKLEEPTEETPFVPPANSSPFWENVLPDSAFSAISDKKDASIQELKDLQSEFSSGLFQTDLTTSGQRPEYDITFNGQNFSAGLFVFDILLNSGLGAIIFLIATLTAIYIITTRSK